jgi:hypothetical protein
LARIAFTDLAIYLVGVILNLFTGDIGVGIAVHFGRNGNNFDLIYSNFKNLLL